MTCPICEGNEKYYIQEFDVGDVKWRTEEYICWDCRLKNNPLKYVAFLIGKTWHKDRGKDTVYVNVYLVGRKDKNDSFTFFRSDNPYSTSIFSIKNA